MSFNSNSIMLRLEAAIRANTPPQRLFYQFLNSNSMEANVLLNQIRTHKEILRLVTSPDGREWIKKNIDGFLNYLAILEQQL
jgi:hypothetical protein